MALAPYGACEKFHKVIVTDFSGARLRPDMVTSDTNGGTAETHAAYDSKIEGNIIFTRVDSAINWMRKNSLWPMPMGLACCARQSDVMIVSGTVTYKMALAVKRIWDQMPEPKWCIAMGACASSGGMYRSYAVLQGIDNLIPVDVYISGCPPRPEALLEGLMRLQRKIEGEQTFSGPKKEATVEA